MKSIVTFHDRICRTAELVGIKMPHRRPRNNRSGYQSSSESDSLFDSDSNDSDDSSILSFKRAGKAPERESCATDSSSSQLRGGPPPPPPAMWPSGLPMKPRLTPLWSAPSAVVPPLAPSPPAASVVEVTVNSVSLSFHV